MKINSNSPASVNLHPKTFTPSAPSAAPEPKEQVQLGAAPAPPDLKYFQWGVSEKSTAPLPVGDFNWGADDDKGSVTPSKTPVTHSKMLVVDHETQISPSPWAKDTGSSNAFFFTDNKTLFQEDIVQHEAGHAALASGKTFAQLLDEISTKTDAAAQGKDPAAAEKATMKALDDMAGLNKLWPTDSMAAGKVGMMSGVGMAGMASGMMGMLGGMGGMLGGMMGGMMGAGMKSPAGLAPSDHFGVIASISQPSASASAAPASAVQAPVSLKDMTPYQQATQIRSAVNDKIAAMGERASFKVDEQLLPVLDKLKMDPVDFFTARACWQGVSTKRRAILEKVLDQFPTLPKDQKNVDAAMNAVEAQGTKLKETDRYFLKYFFAHRKEMKTLFRSTLNLFEGNRVTVYRGQSDSSEYGKDSTKPLGCYSYNPSTSAVWGDNLKRFRVNVNDVWSTSVVSQNANRSEEEVTVYSRGGVRKGEPIKKGEVSQETAAFNARHQPNEFMKLAANSW